MNNCWLQDEVWFWFIFSLFHNYSISDGKLRNHNFENLLKNIILKYPLSIHASSDNSSLYLLFFSLMETIVGNCNTLNSSNQKQARVMTLNLHMLSRVLSLSVDKEHDDFTWAEAFNKTRILICESYFLDVQFFFILLSKV